MGRPGLRFCGRETARDRLRQIDRSIWDTPRRCCVAKPIRETNGAQTTPALAKRDVLLPSVRPLFFFSLLYMFFLACGLQLRP